MLSFLNANIGYNTIFQPPICIPDVPTKYNLKDSPINDRIAVMMLFVGHNNDNYDRAIHSHRVYAKEKGYRFILKTENTSGRNAVWMKLIMIRDQIRMSLVEGDYDWIFYADADSIIMNHLIPLSVFIPPERTGVHFMMAEDGNGLNAGIFMIKVSEWTLEFLTLALNHPEHRLIRIWEEQGAIAVVKNEIQEKKRFQIVPQKWFNAYWVGKGLEHFPHYSYESGDFLVHFPSPQGKKYMKTYLAWVENDSRRCGSETGANDIRQLVNEFWEEKHPIIKNRTVGAV